MKDLPFITNSQVSENKIKFKVVKVTMMKQFLR